MSAVQVQELERTLDLGDSIKDRCIITLGPQINTPNEGGSTYPVFSGKLEFSEKCNPIDIVVKKISCTTVDNVDYVKNEIKCNRHSRQYDQVPIAQYYGWYKEVQPNCLDVFLVFQKVKGVPACRENVEQVEPAKKVELLKSLMGVLRWLHWNNIFHNDLADRLSPATCNMLVDLDTASVCCIIDFGDSTQPEDDDTTLESLIADIRGFQAFRDKHLSLDLEWYSTADPELFECSKVLDMLYAKYADNDLDALQYLVTLELPGDSPSEKCRVLFEFLCTKARVQAPPGSGAVKRVNELW